MTSPAPTDLPAGPVQLERQCKCGGSIFAVHQVAMHIAALCTACGAKVPGWIPRSELGLAPKKIERDGISPWLRSEVLAHYLHRCAWCGVTAIEEELYMGHIVPDHKMREYGFSRLSNHPANLAPTCLACNAGAHLVTRPDLTMILTAAVKWRAERWGDRENERETAGRREDHDNAGPVRAPLRPPGLARVPLPRERQAPDHGERAARGDNGRTDDPATVAG